MVWFDRLEGDWDLETRNVYSKADGHGDSEGGLIPLLKNDEVSGGL